MRVGLLSLLILPLLLLVLAWHPQTAAAAVDLTGTWHLELAFPDRGIKAMNFPDLDLKQTGTAITGVVKNVGGPVKGNVDGSAVTLTINFEGPNGTGGVVFKGEVVNANTMRGTVTMPQLGPGTWTAKR